MWSAVETLEKDGRIVITAVRQNTATKIIVKPEGTIKEPENAAPWQDMVPEALQLLGAELHRTVLQDGGVEVAVTISSINDPDHNDM